MTAYLQLKTIFKRLSHLQYTQRIMQWDEAVMMPQGASDARAAALATLCRTSQKMLISKKTQALINKAKEQGGLSSWDNTNLMWMEKQYNNAADIPLHLVEEFSQAGTLCEQAWRQLRPQNNWQAFLPHFKRSFELIKKIAEIRSQSLQLAPYDVLLDDYAPGFTQKNIDNIFSKLKLTLPPLAQKIKARQATEMRIEPQGPFSIDQQKALGIKVMSALQFDFNRGRLDASHHPFCSGGPTDVRMTTRYDDDEFITSLLGICHETGHALYEQGLPLEWIDQPVGAIHSMAMHESQSLLIEMQVCRSKSFLEYLLPQIKAEFGLQPAFTIDNLLKVITKIDPTNLIRVNADEVTYPLHIIVRYEIEKALFKGEITIEDLPHYWDEGMKKYLGLTTKGNDKDGVMQDVHWPSGAFGYFPAYTLGRLIAAQFFATFANQHPNYQDNIKTGNFAPLRAWLKDNIHSSASSLSTDDLLLKVTGKSLDSDYFIEYVKQSF